MRILSAQINPTVGDFVGNRAKILQGMERARREKIDVVVFSELAICGYPPEDLLFFPKFIQDAEHSLEKIIQASKGLFVVVGTVRENTGVKEKGLFNSAAVIIDGKLAGYKDKTLLPTYDVFDERRYFDPGEKQKIWEYKGKRIGVLICEDVWEHLGKPGFAKYQRDPVLELKELGPDLVLSISASPYYFLKKDVREKVYGSAAKTLACPLVVCNQVGGNEQLIFDGYSMYFNSQGDLVELAKGFVEDDLIIDLEREPCGNHFLDDPLKDLYQALVLGVKDYFYKQGFQTACLGLSGGIDSALTACIAADALGTQNVFAVNMPSRFSSLEGMEDAVKVAKNLRIEMIDIPIDHLYQSYLDLLSPHFVGRGFDVTEENLQARIRGMILMALSNKLGHIILSTGNKSEMAMGFTTLYGDMCGGLGVLIDVSKTQVYHLARWLNRDVEVIPESVIKKPPSAELRNNQKDLDTLPEYSIVDLVLQEYVEEHLSIDEIVKKHDLSYELVQELVERIHLAEYKRRQGPPGIRVTKKAFGKGRVFPIVQGWVR